MSESKGTMLRFSDKEQYQRFKDLAEGRGFGGRAKPYWMFIVELMDHYEVTGPIRRATVRLDHAAKKLQVYEPENLEALISNIVTTEIRKELPGIIERELKKFEVQG